MLEALVVLDRTRPGLGRQLAVALREAIGQGQLQPGTRLPSSRALAATLGLSRGVVVEAYGQLVAEGRLLTRRGSGTMVAPTAPVPIQRAAGAPASGAPASGAPAAGAQPAAHRGPPPVTLRPGVPDLSLFPRAAWRRAYERALARMANAQLDYGDPAGPSELRRELSSYLGRVRAARVDPALLLVTTGAAQAFSLIADTLRFRKVDAVGYEDPGSVAVRRHLEFHGLRPVPIPVDGDGLDVAALERSGVAAVFVTPAHQFPTGVVLAPARRSALIEWARRTGGLIVEDDYDAEYRYDREPIGCLQGIAPDVVAYVGSVSKALAPAMRIGWLATPARYRDEFAERKTWADLGGPVLEQLAFADLLASGGYDRHLRRARLEHRRRRDALVAALHRHLPGLPISGVAAGLHLVLELPPGVDDEALAGRLHAAGLWPLALSPLRIDGGGPPGLVLGYAATRPAELDRAVHTLARTVKSASGPPVQTRPANRLPRERSGPNRPGPWTSRKGGERPKQCAAAQHDGQ